ncbi:MAG: hypothetical protein IJA12_06505 [Oscillospiraceae bacterium]|nr:hypothetical protein [Oscillospiraceae bacterium]
MINFLPAVFSVISCCIVYTVGFTFIPSIRERKKEYITKGIIFTIISAVVALILSVLISSFTRFETAPSAYSGAIAGTSCFMGFVVSKFVNHENLKKFLRRLGIVALVIFLLESTVFNFRSFTNDTETFSPDLSIAFMDDPAKVSIEGDTVTYTDGGTLIIPVNTADIKAVSLDIESEDEFFKSTIFIKDENFSNNATPVGSKYTSGKYDDSLHFAISPYGEITELYVALSELGGTATLKNITFAQAMPYEFYNLRFTILFVIAAVVAALVSFKLHRVTYNHRSVLHKLILVAVTLACASTMFYFNIPEELPIEYSAELDMNFKDPYTQMFDAVKEGRTNIDMVPDQALLDLENPYDPSTRDGISYPWDRALYNGKFYSYYGITPVLLLHFPYYWIMGDIPTMNTTCQVFGMLAIIFMFGAITAFVKRFIKKPNFLLMIIMMVSSCVMTGLFMAVHYSNQYNVPNVTSTCFLMLCLWCGVCAANRVKEKKSVPLFILSGIAFILCLAARPTKAISALILAPLFIAVLLNKDLKISKKITSVMSFIVPIAIGMAGVMWYNFIRFDSPFDFGQKYQLTISNIFANSIDFSLFPASIIHYFFQPLHLSGDFPYITLASVALCNNGQFTYEANTCGVFAFPIILVGCLIMPFLVWHTRHRKTTPYRYNENRIRNYTYVLMMVLMVALAFMNYCMAGIIVDYLNDLLPVLMLMSLLVILETQQRLEKFPVLVDKGICAFSAISIVSVIIFIGIILSIRGYVLYSNFPTMLTELEKFVCFWH